MLFLIGKEAFTAVVFEEVNGNCVRVLGAAVGTFVAQDFLREVKTPPFFWATPELLRRVKRGESPVLSDKQVQEENSTSGLSLYVWHTGVSVEDNKRPEVHSALVGEFVRQYRGYRIKELLQQAESLENFHGMRIAGGMRISPRDGRYEDYWEIGPVDAIHDPQLVGLTAGIAHRMKSSWISTLFNYEPPRFRFTRGEQRVLTCALNGGTDEEISNQLCVSFSAVTRRGITFTSASSRTALLLFPKTQQELGKKVNEARKRRIISWPIYANIQKSSVRFRAEDASGATPANPQKKETISKRWKPDSVGSPQLYSAPCRFRYTRHIAPALNPLESRP